MNVTVAPLPAIIHHAFGLVVKGEPLRGRRIGRQIGSQIIDSKANQVVREGVLAALQDPGVGPEAVVVLQQLMQNEIGYPPPKMTEFFCSCAEQSKLDLLDVAAALEGRKEQKAMAGEPDAIYRAQRLGVALFKKEQFSLAQKGIALRIALADIADPECFGNLLGIACGFMNNNVIERGTMLQAATMGIIDPYARGRALAAALVDVDHAVKIYGLLRYATKDLQNNCQVFSALVLLVNTVAAYRDNDAKNIIRSFFCRQVEDYLDTVEADDEDLTLAERWYHEFSGRESLSQRQMTELFAYLH